MVPLTEQHMAELIRRALEADGLTQADFARRTGVSTKHLNLVLSGKATARPAALDYWAFALGREFLVALAPTAEGDGRQPLMPLAYTADTADDQPYDDLAGG